MSIARKVAYIELSLISIELDSTNFAINMKLLKCKYYGDNNSSNYLQLFRKFLMLNSLWYKLNLTELTSLSNEKAEM